MLHVHAGSGGVFLVRKPKCPLVVTSHHTYLQEAEIVFGSSWLKSTRKKLMGILEARTYRLADAVVCVSRDTADFIISRYGIDATKVSVIENGIEERSAVPAVEATKNVILFVGRLEQRKGIWVLFDAFKKLAATHADLHLRFAGQDLEWGAMRQAITKAGLSDRIAITGYLHEPMLLRELKSATVLVVPSLLEGFGLIAADAMKLGMCVIVSDAAGLKSLIEDGRTGLVFRSGDDSDLAAAIQKAVADPELRKRLGEAAFAEAKKRFSYPERAKDLQQVFDTVARKPSF